MIFNFLPEKLLSPQRISSFLQEPNKRMKRRNGPGFFGDAKQYGEGICQDKNSNWPRRWSRKQVVFLVVPKKHCNLGI